MTNHQELINLWRESSKEPNFIKWLDNKQKKCDACSENCGNPWCPFTEDSDDNDEKE